MRVVQHDYQIVQNFSSTVVIYDNYTYELELHDIESRMPLYISQKNLYKKSKYCNKRWLSGAISMSIILPELTSTS